MAYKTGRYKAIEWKEFEEISDEKGLKKQRCIHCNNNISSKIERIREHLNKCKVFAKKKIQISESCFDNDFDNFGDDTSVHKNDPVPMSSPKRALTVSPLKRSASVLSDVSTDSFSSSCTTMLSPKIDRFVHKTTDAEKKLLDLQAARVFYACNIPFSG